MKIYCLIVCLLFPFFQNPNTETANKPSVSVLEDVVLTKSGNCRYKKLSFKSEGNETKAFEAHVVLFQSNSYKAELVDQPSNNPNNHQTIAKITETRGGVVGINGGFFTKEFMPNGL